MKNVNTMNMRKRGYYEFDPCIYPRILWVVIGCKDVIMSEFDGVDEADFTSEHEYDAITFESVVHKDTGRYGVLVYLKSCSRLSFNVVAHEASHVCDAFETTLGIVHGDEPSAYLLGWVVSCINKVRFGQGDIIEITDKGKEICLETGK